MAESKTRAPFGTWKSPVRASDIASGTIRLGQVFVDTAAGEPENSSIYWLEGRPSEGGRTVIVGAAAGGDPEDLLPAPFDARSLVHEYGGAAMVVHRSKIYFVNYKDQRLYLLERGAEPRAVTPDGPWRYADMAVSGDGRYIVCVLEEHVEEGREPENKLAVIDLQVGSPEPRTIAHGHDFYACPRFSPSGDELVYLAWDHPNMPWDGTYLYRASIGADFTLEAPRLIAGEGGEESVFQPSYSPSGALHFVSDRDGFWNLFRLDEDQSVRSVKVLPDLAGREFGMPLWVFGMSTYAFLADDSIVVASNDLGVWHLGLISGKDGSYSEFDRSDGSARAYTEFAYVVSNGASTGMLAGSPVSPMAVVSLEPGSGVFTVRRQNTSIELDPGYMSRPEVIEFPTTGEKTAYAFYYPPLNKDFEGEAGELPPLLVKSHGGPTGSTSTTLNLACQYWTSRGFAVVDVNYGGSTGYGREYMKRLEGNWGVVDVDDCENAALYLVREGKVDGERLAITGGSAGGYTTLCVLTFKDSFKAGASHFGIGDLESLALETHKFESRYGDRLVGPYPERKDLYYERSPINFTDRLSCPLIVFQGLEDKVVPPSQAEAMVKALREKKLPVAYIAYEGEQHGFRKAANIKRTLEAEFYFYCRIFGIQPADRIEPVSIDNLKAGAPA
ncbi:MAG: prolyl oligopeptidase family serine peptidase [Candidatus Obscuribacterales bacterium]